MGYEKKYGSITTERGDIPDDEPVFVLRAQDAAMVATLDAYLSMCSGLGSPQRHLNGIQEARETVRVWQQEHPDRVKTPQSHSLAEP